MTAPVQPGSFPGETVYHGGMLWTWDGGRWSSDLQVVTVAPFDGGADGGADAAPAPADGGADGPPDGPAGGPQG